MIMLPAWMSPTEQRRADELAAMLEGITAAEGHQLEPLVALAATLRPVPQLDQITAPRADFRTALRERLLVEAAAHPPAFVPEQRTSPDLRPRHRVRRVVATGMTVGLLAGTGAAAASTHALPGDPLYGLKRGLEAVELRLAGSDLSRGRELLEQADGRLSEAEALAASADSRSAVTTGRVATALTEMDVATRSGADALNTSYADTGDSEGLLLLDRFVVDQRQRLVDLQDLVDPALRPRLLGLDELLGRLQTRLATLLDSTGSASAAGPASPAPGVGADSPTPVSADGGAGDQTGKGGSGGVGGVSVDGTVSGGGRGLVPEAASGVDEAVKGLTGSATGGSPAGGATSPGSSSAPTSASASASGSNSAGGGVLDGRAGSATTPAPRVSSTTSVPLPDASLPVPTVPAPVVEAPPAPPAAAPRTQVSVPAVSPPEPDVAPPPLPAPPCVPTPVTHC